MFCNAPGTGILYSVHGSACTCVCEKCYVVFAIEWVLYCSTVNIWFLATDDGGGFRNSLIVRFHVS